MTPVDPLPLRPPPGHVPVEQRWLGLDRRTVVPGLAVLALALLWAVVVPLIDGAVSQDREVEAGTVLGAGRGVTVVPPVGWNIDSGLDPEDAGTGLPSQQVVRVSSGGTTVRVEAVRWDGSVRGLLDRAAEVHEDDPNTDPGWHLTGGTGTLRTDEGVVGAGRSYTSAGGDGRLAAFLHDGVGALVTVGISPSELATHRHAIDEMIASLRLYGKLISPEFAARWGAPLTAPSWRRARRRPASCC